MTNSGPPSLLGGKRRVGASANGLSAIVVMGPSGCGKSTLGLALAEALGWRFVEGDAHHPPGNVAKMQAGEPLSEADRLPFLTGIGRELARPGGAVASCSALRRVHRDVLRSFAGNILFVWPDTPEHELARRIVGRARHFMPASLLHSQLSALEPPAADEAFLKLDGSLPVASQVRTVLHHLRTP